MTLFFMAALFILAFLLIVTFLATALRQIG